MDSTAIAQRVDDCDPDVQDKPDTTAPAPAEQDTPEPDPSTAD